MDVDDADDAVALFDEVDAFLRDGFVKVEGAFARRTARALQVS
jgi:hypothetical protein